jgi:outer membrane biogenesis lipoprotein LolB
MRRRLIALAAAAAVSLTATPATAEAPTVQRVKIGMGDKVVIRGFKAEDQARINYRADGTLAVRRVQP